MNALAGVGPVAHTARFEALLRASKAICACHDPKDLSQILADQLYSVIDFTYLDVVVFKENAREVQWRVMGKGQPEYPDVPVEETTAWWVYQQQEPLHISDWNHDPRFPHLKRALDELGFDIRSNCRVPLTTGRRRWGALGIGSARPNEYSEKDVRIVSLLADHVALAIENAFNFEVSHKAQAELEHKNARLQLLLDLTSNVVSSLELRELLRAVAASVRRVMTCDVVGVLLPAPDGQHLRLFAVDFPESKGLLREEILIPIDRSAPGEAFRTGVPVVKCPPDETSDAAEVADSEHYRRVVGEGVKIGCLVPLSSRGRILGVLALGRRQESSFDADDVDFLSQVAGQVGIAVDNALAYGEIADLRDKLAEEKLYLEDEIRGEMDFEGIVGQSSALRQVLQMVDTVAPSDSTVLLLGETGTGKELIARAIHDRSRRKDRTFVKLNCAAIPTGLLESELFGHERGAFTGAISQRVGRMELADQGTLFLDEVGDIPLELQPKLLRALQEREFERLGSTRTKKVDVRMVAATNRNLEQMIGDGRFRSDLYYRLNVFPIPIPPLRERPEDIPLLVRYFTQKHGKRMERQIDSVPSGTMKKLTRWHWPGNIRELENLIERAVILTRGAALQVPVSELDHYSSRASARVDHDGRDQLLRILRETRGRVGGADGAAARMGLKRTTLISRMRKMGIDPRAVS